jgi:hypothetical protein
MDSLFTIFIVQVIIWTLLFILICYIVRKNALLKKKIKLLKNAGITNIQDPIGDPGGETLGSPKEKKEAN